MEYEVVILKPAELILKSKGVRKQFEQKLIHNIKDCLKKKEVEFDHIIRGQARYFIYTPEPEEVLAEVKNIFGISNMFKAMQVGANIKTIKTTIFDLAKELAINNKSSFGIRATTVNSNINMSSREIETEVGSYIQEKTKAKVNLTKPDFWLRVEIVGPKAFVYYDVVVGLNGLPLGTAGKALALISEKEQDILAAWLIMRRGCEIIPLHIRETESGLVQFQKNCKKLEKFAWGSRVKPISIKGSSKDRKEIEKKAEEHGCKAIIMGSLDHKTLECNLPVFEPLVGLDKKQLKDIKAIVI
jgi:tRNA uracil 4-sulfurtransferase